MRTHHGHIFEQTNGQNDSNWSFIDLIAPVRRKTSFRCRSSELQHLAKLPLGTVIVIVNPTGTEDDTGVVTTRPSPLPATAQRAQMQPRAILAFYNTASPANLIGSTNENVQPTYSSKKAAKESVRGAADHKA